MLTKKKGRGEGKRNTIIQKEQLLCCEVRNAKYVNRTSEHKDQSGPFKHNKQWHFHLCDVKGKIQNNDSSTIKKETNQDPGAGKTIEKFI